MSTHLGRITDNILCIGDPHLPAGHIDYLPFLKATQKKYKCKVVLCVGDMVDFHALSYHESDPDLPSAGDELNLAIDQMKLWERAFPSMVISEGNHTKLPQRQAKTMGLPKAFLKGYNEVFGLKGGWVWEPSHVTFNLECGMPVLMQHAWSSSLEAGRRALSSESVIGGHYHSQSGVAWSQDTQYRRFYMATGCGVDPDHPAMYYGKNGARSIHILSCGVIVNGTAIVVPMWLTPEGRWNGKL